MNHLLLANRGEIAVRIFRAAAELGVRTLAVYSEDDGLSLHTRRADTSHPLRGAGVSAYLDAEQILAVAREYGCDAIHPGYGFLSEDAAFARRCEEMGILFVGPSSETLELFGNKVRTRGLAASCAVRLLPGSPGPVNPEQAEAFLSSLDGRGSMIIKAVAGGGGRGMRVVSRPEDVREAYQRCRSEALKALGNGDLYVEQFMERARHIEIQVVGDGSGAASHLGERECSIQRRHQKLVEIAPCPSLPAGLRRRIAGDAVRMAEAARYRNLGTFEFLVNAVDMDDDSDYAFIEANPRLQVEHTVTEAVTGLDLVRMQLEIAGGGSLAAFGLDQSDLPEPRGHAIEVRVNLETMDADGTARPAGGTVTAFETPSGPGIRVDTAGHVGYPVNPTFDPLLAKLIGHCPSPDFAAAVSRTNRALSEFRIEGVKTNIPFLKNLLKHPEFGANRIHTRFVEDHLEELVGPDVAEPPGSPLETSASGRRAGTRVDRTDPLAVLDYGKAGGGLSVRPAPGNPSQRATTLGTAGLEHAVAVKSQMQGTVVSIEVWEGEAVHKGRQILVMDSMKMEHVIRSEVGGVVLRVAVEVGDTVYEGQPLVFLEPREIQISGADTEEPVDPDRPREDLDEVRQRQEKLLDPARPEAVAKRRQRGQRTARENLADLCDPGTFEEYGGLVIAAQRGRRSVEDLIRNTPADGLVAGVGRVNGDLFEEERARCVVMAYDYTVLAGTQGFQNHKKKDRMFEVAERMRLPVVIFTEGGGGRPGDTEGFGVAGLDCMAFHLFGRLSGRVPLVGINSGKCFAGNAALLGCCDVVIAARDSNIGMGGPAMIEGGGLGVFLPEDVGPIDVQVPSGVVDIAVKDEAEAVRKAKQYLSYFQGPVKNWDCADQRALRGIIPENRVRIYDVRSVIDTLSDRGSVLELRPRFGTGMITALVRIEGRPMGLVANNPSHLAGAIDSPAADKAARFMQLCDTFDLPILFLCDTPGIMVGPEVEKTALVRHCCRMFVTGANLSVPFFTIVLRKAYGLGAQAMAGGSFRAPVFTVAWPTGEFGGMGLEGAVKLGFRKELAAVEDPEERNALFEKMVAMAYEHGKALNTATHFEIDNVIDPAESRRLIAHALSGAPAPAARGHKKRPCIDTW